ncbi:MAG: hypothetical protein K2Z80_26900 [Xanthobacteraceae bacterium]|nr:hypothetical protein [Xanthobacteraceae bacterium]
MQSASWRFGRPDQKQPDPHGHDRRHGLAERVSDDPDWGGRIAGIRQRFQAFASSKDHRGVGHGLRLGMSGTAAVFAKNAGVIGPVDSILIWVGTRRIFGGVQPEQGLSRPGVARVVFEGRLNFGAIQRRAGVSSRVGADDGQ